MEAAVALDPAAVVAFAAAPAAVVFEAAAVVAFDAAAAAVLAVPVAADTRGDVHETLAGGELLALGICNDCFVIHNQELLLSVVCPLESQHY